MPLRYRLIARRSRIEGRGIFAAETLPARRKLGEVTGRIRPLRASLKTVATQKRIYLVDLGRAQALDCSEGNVFRFLNHSCQPNCYLRQCGLKLEVYSLLKIKTGEELTIDYIETPHRHGMTCRCKLPGCRGIL